MALRQERHDLTSGTQFTLWHVLHYRSVFSDSHTYAHTHTLIYSKSVSPHRWNCFQGKGKKKCFTLFILWRKIKLSQAVVTVVFPLTLDYQVVEMLSHHQADKSRRKFNYISVKCERFFFQSKRMSTPVQTFTFNLFSDIGPRWGWRRQLQNDWTNRQCESSYFSKWTLWATVEAN